MLADDQAVEDVCLPAGSFVERLGPGGIHVSISTISPDAARRLAEHHKKHQVEYIAAPVFGRPEAAAAKRLWVCVSGAAEAKQRVRPLLDAIGQGIFDFGEEAAAANVVKLCGNFLIASAIEALAETLTLARKNGIDPKSVADMLGKTLFACPVYQGYGKSIARAKIRTGRFPARARLEGHQSHAPDRRFQRCADAFSQSTPRPLDFRRRKRPRKYGLDRRGSGSRRRCRPQIEDAGVE